MPSAETPLLEARGIRRAFGPLVVLRQLDLQLLPGRLLAVVGPNGAGKTTLLRILAGLMRPDAGSVLVRGLAHGPGDPASRRTVGLISHASLLYDDLTPLENLTFVARLYRLAEPRTVAWAALEEFDLAAVADRPVGQLSRGLTQRVAIARAVLHRPEVLLLDEPFTGLDAPAADRLHALLRQQLGDGRAVAMVTHHLAEAWQLADTVGVLAAGGWAHYRPRAGTLEQFLPRYQELIRG